jgi:hypothetical protein
MNWLVILILIYTLSSNMLFAAPIDPETYEDYLELMQTEWESYKRRSKIDKNSSSFLP